MLRTLTRRVFKMALTLSIALVAVFFLIHLAPGDPVSGMINPQMTPEMKEQIRAGMGLDQPLWTQFVHWLRELARGNLGYSTLYQQPVAAVIKTYIWPTVALSLFALILSLLIGIPAGVFSAVRPNGLGDKALGAASIVGLSMPPFFLALVLIKLLAFDHKWFPMFGMMDQALTGAPFHERALNILWHMILPGTVLATSGLVMYMRYTRNAMLEVLDQDHITTARSKGLSECVVIYRHAFRSAMIPIVTLLGFELPSLVSGAVITESVFGWPGLGKVAVDAILARDYPLVMAINLMNIVLLMAGMLLSDALYVVADPRIHYRKMYK